MRINRNPIALLASIGILVAATALALATTPACAALGDNFGIESFEAPLTQEGGAPFTQAGGHPFDYATTISFVGNGKTSPVSHREEPEGDVRDVHVEMPPGLVGNPQAVPTCAENLLEATSSVLPECPPETQVGVATVDISALESLVTVPVYNMAAPGTVPAEFGFNVSGVAIVHLVPSVRTGGDYGINIDIRGNSQAVVKSTKVTLWGVPYDAAHNSRRAAVGQNFVCVLNELFCFGNGTVSLPPKPFLTTPTDCSSGPIRTTLAVDSWQHPGLLDAEWRPDLSDPNWKTADFVAHENGEPTSPLAFSGCERLPFDPSISVRPSTTVAGVPAAYNIDLHMPYLENPTGLEEASLKKVVFSLPQGVTVSPSAAQGLGACAPDQIGLTTTKGPSCPDSSKIGTVEIDTPLLGRPMTGSVYLAQQGNNPFNSLLALYLVAEGNGIRIKLPGEVTPDPVTGQLTATFDKNPQLPFTDVKVDLNGGPRAPLVNPTACGAYTTTAQLTPYSGPQPVSRSDSFTIDQGCASPRPFAPVFTAGTASPQAGGFSPFTLTFSRGDAEQNLSGVNVQMPPGLLGVLKNVPRCGEPQAASGACGPESLIGHTTVGAGAGPSPFWLGGNVYLTGPYHGAPFGLSVVVPAIAGPFDLGNVVVRAAVTIDPHAAQVSVSSDPLPTILQGIPLDLRTVNVTIDRSGFMFNPTNCSPSAVTGAITSTAGTSAGVSSRFQAANCASLPFKPKLTALTQAHTSKAGGAYLHVKVASGSGQANIGKVRVLLPKALPSRLTTLQKACREATFDANPSSCPAASVVGAATAVTPVLQSPLRGPAYLVSHGGAAFPDLVVVLQDEGITLYLDGNTDIKKGITSSTFNSVPDAPISTFDLVLPEGPHSALAAHGSLCKTALNMPTAITGQNGAMKRQTTKIAVSGCPKHRAKVHRRKGRKK